MITSFRDLIVWQKSHELTLLVYELTRNFPNYEIYALVSQMRRAAFSVSANIVEGFTRRSTKHELHFYNIADGSLSELKYYVILAKDLEYIDQDNYQKMDLLTNEVGKLLYGWMKSQK